MSTETEKADSASVIILWFFSLSQRRTSFFSDLLAHLFSILCMSLNAWHNKSWHALTSLCSDHRSSQKRESLTSFFCAEKLLALSCLITVELQWSFRSWTDSYVVQALYKLTLMFLFLFRKIFWLFIISFICEEASFSWDSVICLMCFLCLRFMTEFSWWVEIWNELWQWEELDDSVLFSRAFFWWLCMLLQSDVSCCFSSFSLVSERQLSSDKDSEKKCTSQLSMWSIIWSYRCWWSVKDTCFVA